MTGTISIEVRPHWVSGWFLRWAAKPFVRVDGEERPVTWRRPWSVAVDEGDHEVAAGIRYTTGSRLLGTQPREVRVDAGQTLALVAQNGSTNGSRFTVRQARRP